MNTQTLIRQFAAIGAELDITIQQPIPSRRVVPVRRNSAQDFTLDIAERKGREVFTLSLRSGILDTLDMLVVDVRPKERHLLLLAKPLDGSGEKRKFLCGHDERHWFVAAVPDAEHVARIKDAMEALKPFPVRLSQRRNGVKAKDWNARHNAGFVRQGEWFFLPQPNFAPPNANLILEDEPIRRGGGKPHMVEHLYRHGGTRVYVNGHYPNGLTEPQYKALLSRRPEAQAWPWNVMQRNPAVYALGKIRHPDHATLTLPFWHRVVMSQEQNAANVAFLD
ncbi:MAG: hypothetical protein JWL77_4555 [Chthonomonadaceae bacterium]|nr:hypothetical protein [Chthonomonadaceae bacterium]